MMKLPMSEQEEAIRDEHAYHKVQTGTTMSPQRLMESVDYLLGLLDQERARKFPLIERIGKLKNGLKEIQELSIQVLGASSVDE